MLYPSKRGGFLSLQRSSMIVDPRLIFEEGFFIQSNKDCGMVGNFHPLTMDSRPITGTKPVTNFPLLKSSAIMAPGVERRGTWVQYTTELLAVAMSKIALTMTDDKLSCVEYPFRQILTEPELSMRKSKVLFVIALMSQTTENSAPSNSIADMDMFTSIS